MRRLSFLIGIVLPILLLELGCRRAERTEGRLDQQTKVQTITLGTFSKSLGNAPYYIAKHFRWFESEPALKQARIAYVEFNDRPTISQAFDKRELDLLLSAEVPAILCRSQGNDIRAVEVAGIVRVEILARSELPIHSVQDLKGRSVAVLQGTSSHFGLLRALKSVGLSPTDVDIRYMGPTEAKSAFENRQIEAWAVWSPFTEQQVLTDRGRVIEGGDAVIANVVSMRRDLIIGETAAARALVRILQRAKAWTVSHPNEARPIIAQELNLDEKVVSEALRKFDYAKHLDASLIQDFQDKADFLANEQKARQEKPVDVRLNFVDLRLVR